MSAAPGFPPLLRGQALPGGRPYAEACAAARAGAEPGLVLYDPLGADLQAALVFAPEVPRREAAVMLPLAGVALQNALGSVAPPEVALHLGWDGAVLVNGGRAGRLRAAAAPGPEDAVPDWLVIGLELRFEAPEDDGGLRPGETALYAEGCGELTPLPLLESWTRHLLHWLHDWETDGLKALHRDYAGLVWQLGEETELAGRRGHFLGLDEGLGALLKTGGTTEGLALHMLLEDGE
ncbi:hypothetical protein LR948_08440 [Roseivivax sp. GX 12232]|uniref:biotin/lipoate--protein ligase family protein n=1 Tax=Roseivivax sp. GX 12232 TaxID=2900547 RepID=UPI001E43917D|nr:biotin/lipoate--protein ligase family protein [Roseivivax sp. GX 12232]MCE0505376.1 hypothetical protein [Roseivivax sp. GX 12232]